MASTTLSGGGQRAARAAVTLADIAVAVGVSRATVSLVLRGSPLVGAKTRAKVEAELDRQQYVYNRAAANLRRRTSSSVALVINDLSNPFFAEFAAGVDDALAEAGYVTLLGSTGESSARQDAVLASLMEQSPAGVILSPAEGSVTPALQRALGRARNVLVFNREPIGTPWDVLALDNACGSHLATRHLLQRGHRRIAFYGAHADSSASAQRQQGYEQAMLAAGLVPHIVPCAPNRARAAAGAAALHAGDAPPTAVVCYNDDVAFGACAGLACLGLRPGIDIAVTGFDDIAEAALGTPSLTTVAVDPRARGRQAAQMLLQRIAAPDAPMRRTVAAVTLQVRASSNVILPGSPDRDTARVHGLLPSNPTVR